MTELFIDGYPVSLPVDFEIDYYVYNPFFTKKGEYTYDIDIDLRDKENVKVYKHINRMHVGLQPTGRKAILIANSKVIVSGTEIILSLEDDKVKIQIVAGNSELNYLSAGNTKMKELDLGVIERLDSSIAIQSLNHCFPDYNFVCAPVYSTYDQTETGSEASTSKFFNLVKPDINSITRFEDNLELCPQPYLLYFLQKICEALGYKVSDNVLLNDERFSRTIIVHGYRTMRYNEMVPNWTVDEFLSEIEKLCNVIIVVNQLTKRIRIMNVSSFYNDSVKIYISKDKMLDRPEKQFNVDESLYMLYNNVSYDFPDNDFYKYICLDEGLLKRCHFIHVATYNDLYIELYGSNDKQNWYKVDVSPKYNKLDIYVVDDTGLFFVLYKYVWAGTTMYNFRLVNTFKNIIDKNTSNSTVFKIVPAEIAVKQWVRYDGKNGYDLFAPLPIIRNAPSTEQGATNDNGLNEFIKSGVPEEPTPDRIFIALYDGIQYMMGWDGKKTDESKAPEYVYPYSYTSSYYSARRDDLSFYDCQKVFKYGNENRTLMLDGNRGLYETLYNKNMKVDTENEYVIRFISDLKYNSLEIFVLDNKEYFCKRLHYKIRADGIAKDIEGTFYSNSN